MTAAAEREERVRSMLPGVRAFDGPGHDGPAGRADRLQLALQARHDRVAVGNEFAAMRVHVVDACLPILRRLGARAER